MALAAGDTVFLAASVGLQGRKAPPLLGKVESITPTVVDWGNGQVVTYTDDSQIYKVLSPADFSVFGAWMQSLVNNAGQRFSGPCVGVWGVNTAAGADLGDFLVVRCFDGLYFVSAAAQFEKDVNR